MVAGVAAGAEVGPAVACTTEVTTAVWTTGGAVTTTVTGAAGAQAPNTMANSTIILMTYFADFIYFLLENVWEC